MRGLRAGLIGLLALAAGPAFSQSQTLLPPIIPQLANPGPLVNPCTLVQSSSQGQIITNCVTGTGGGVGLSVTDGTTTIPGVNQIAFMGATVGGSSPNAVIDISAGGGTSSNFSSAFPGTGTAAGAEYLASPPSWSNAQMVPFLVDANGNLKVNVSAGGGSGGTSSTYGASFPSVGTAAGAEYLASPPTLSNGNMVPLQTDSAGNLKVLITGGAGSGGTSSNYGSAFPSAGTASGFEYLASPPTLTTGQMVAGQTDVNGNLKVNIAAGATGGTSSLFATSFPSTGTAAGAEYLASPPTLSNAQMVPLFTDINGNLKVNIQAGAGSGGTASSDNSGFTYGTSQLTPVGGVYNSSITSLTSGSTGVVALTADRNMFENVNRWAGTQLGAASNYGTSPGAVAVPGVNAYVTNTPAVSQSGTWTVQPGNTANTTPWLVTGSGTAGSPASGVLSIQGVTPMTPVQVSQATASALNATITGSGSAGSPASGVVTIQGISSMTPLQVVPSVPSGDACKQGTHHYKSINQTASAQLITGTSSKKTYICSINFVVAGNENLALVEGTGSVCATNIFGMAGGTTAASGWNLIANGGLVVGNGDAAAIGPPDADSNATAANVCLLESGSDQVSGQVTYVQQ